MSEFRDKLLEVNHRINTMNHYDPAAALPADADSADAIEQVLLARVHLSTAVSMMAELRKKYQLTDYSESEEDLLKNASFSMLHHSIGMLEDMDNELELVIDNIADSEDGETEFVLGLLEEYEESGEFPERL